MASLAVYSVGTDNIQCYVYGLDRSYTATDRALYWYLNTNFIGTTALAPGVAASDLIPIVGLTPGTTFSFMAFIGYAGSAFESAGTVTVTTASSSRPAYFVWSTQKVSGEPFSLAAAEWNRLTANINAVRLYRGLTILNFTQAYTDAPLTAAIYNEAVLAIQGVPGYGAYIYTASPGQIITAARLNDLVGELNAFP